MSTADTKALIEEGIAQFQKEVPALQKLKLVMELELRGRGDIQLFRVEVPGPKITKDIASDAKVRLSVPRSDFNELAREGTIRHWREAFESGHRQGDGAARDPATDRQRRREAGRADAQPEAPRPLIRTPSASAADRRTRRRSASSPSSGVNWKATGVRSPGSSGSRLATISILGVAFH